MDGVERVMVLGIFIVIVLILGVLAWDASHEDPAVASALGADGGPGAGATRLERPDDPRAELAPGLSASELGKQLEEARRRASERNADTEAEREPQSRSRPAGQPTVAAADDGGARPAGRPGDDAGTRRPAFPGLKSTVPSVAPALTPAAPEPRVHVVAEGETAWRIANEAFGPGDLPALLDAIQDLNPGVDLENLRPGQKLVLPHEPPADAVLPTPAERAAAGEGRTYEVVAGDTLRGIAGRHLGDPGRWQEIYDANRHLIESPSRLSVGVVLVLPEE